MTRVSAISMIKSRNKIITSWDWFKTGSSSLWFLWFLWLLWLNYLNFSMESITTMFSVNITDQSWTEELASKLAWTTATFRTCAHACMQPLLHLLSYLSSFCIHFSFSSYQFDSCTLVLSFVFSLLIPGPTYPQDWFLSVFSHPYFCLTEHGSLELLNSLPCLTFLYKYFSYFTV